MNLEIERKFLVKDDRWRQGLTGIFWRQGYIPASGCSIRVRVSGDKAFLTMKKRAASITRLEYEYPIPVNEGNELIDYFCQKPLIEKTRYYLKTGKHTWEIDEFEEENKGLIVAEIELGSEDEQFDRPDWLGEEVTADTRYLNANLVNNPYTKWKSDIK